MWSNIGSFKEINDSKLISYCECSINTQVEEILVFLLGECKILNRYFLLIVCVYRITKPRKTNDWRLVSRVIFSKDLSSHKRTRTYNWIVRTLLFTSSSKRNVLEACNPLQFISIVVSLQLLLWYMVQTHSHMHTYHIIQFSTIFISKSTKYELNRRKHLHLFCSFTRSHSIFIRSFEHWHCDTSRVRATMQEEEAHNDIDDNNRI